MATTLTPYQRDILVRTVLGEARGEGVRGMEAVAHVIANRANSGRYPSDPAAVALQPSQFSVWNQGEGRGKTDYDRDSREYKTAAEAIDRVFSGQSQDPTNGALFYHTPQVNPAWSREVNRYGTTQIGNHIFYNGNPVPPREIPNVVASQLDVQRPVPLPTPVTERRMMGTSDAPTSAMSRAYPTLNATPRLGNGGIFAYSAPDMQPAQITQGIGSLTPDFFSRPANIDPVGLGPQSLATVQDMYGRPTPAPVPLPRPRPAMGGDPGGGTMSLPIASLPTTTARLPAIPSRATDTAPRPTQAQIRADNGQTWQRMSGDTQGGGVMSLPIASLATPARLPAIPPRATDTSPRLTPSQIRDDNGQTSQRMSGDTRGGGVITPIATIPTTRQAVATPAPASNVGRAPTTRAVQSVPVTPSLPIAAVAPVAPIAPAALTPIQAQRAEQLAMRNAGVSRPIVQPTAAQVEAATGLRLPNMATQPSSTPKDQARLAAVVPPAASAVPLTAAPQIQVVPAPRAVTGYPTPVANRPAIAPRSAAVTGFPTPAAMRPLPALPQRSLAAIAMPTPVSQRPSPQPTMRVTVNGAGSYGGGSGGGSGGSSQPQTITGSSTGRTYNVGQEYQAGGYKFVATPDGFKNIGRV